MTTAASRFNAAFAQITKEIPFNKDWSNGTGYFDNAVSGPAAPQLTIAEIVKSAAPAGRKIIIVGTRLGNVVVFERYDDDKSVIVANYGSAIGQLHNIKSGALDIDSVCNIVGEFSIKENIGTMIEQIYDACKKFDKRAERKAERESAKEKTVEKRTYTVGQIVTAQLGNSSDSDGYEESVEMEVIAVNISGTGLNYLVRKVDDHDYLAVGDHIPHLCDKDIYSTMAVRAGTDRGLSRERAANMLGFNIKDHDLLNS